MKEGLTAICPYWGKPCEEIRKTLQATGADCGFVTKLQSATPSALVGAPPTITVTDICVHRALQISLNNIQQGLGIIMQMVQPKNTQQGWGG